MQGMLFGKWQSLDAKVCQEAGWADGLNMSENRFPHDISWGPWGNNVMKHCTSLWRLVSAMFPTQHSILWKPTSKLLDFKPIAIAYEVTSKLGLLTRAHVAAFIAVWTPEHWHFTRTRHEAQRYKKAMWP